MELCLIRCAHNVSLCVLSVLVCMCGRARDSLFNVCDKMWAVFGRWDSDKVVVLCWVNLNIFFFS